MLDFFFNVNLKALNFKVNKLLHVEMITIISGTNRPDSRSGKIAEYYSKLLQIRKQPCRILDLQELPSDFMFSAMFEHTGKNTAFNEFTHIVATSEKFVFIVPEYNGSFPGILKAFIDALAYPSSFNNKKCALVGISSGTMGGALALSHLTDILNYVGMQVLAIKPRLGRIGTTHVDGVITDAFLSTLLEKQADELIKF
jgi:chromate reductase